MSRDVKGGRERVSWAPTLHHSKATCGLSHFLPDGQGPLACQGTIFGYQSMAQMNDAVQSGSHCAALNAETRYHVLKGKCLPHLISAMHTQSHVYYVGVERNSTVALLSTCLAIGKSVFLLSSSLIILDAKLTYYVRPFKCCLRS